MAAAFQLRQSGFVRRTHILLEDGNLESRIAEAFTKKKRISYGEVLAIIRDSEKVYVIGTRETVDFFNEPGKPEFEVFVDELLRRVVATT